MYRADSSKGETERWDVTIKSLTRLNNSISGNPRFYVRFTDGTAANTASDSMLSLEIENSRYQDTPLMVVYNAQGRINFAEPLPEPASAHVDYHNWTVDSAMWQIRHGDQTSARTMSALDYIENLARLGLDRKSRLD